MFTRSIQIQESIHNFLDTAYFDALVYLVRYLFIAAYLVDSLVGCIWLILPDHCFQHMRFAPFQKIFFGD